MNQFITNGGTVTPHNVDGISSKLSNESNYLLVWNGALRCYSLVMCEKPTPREKYFMNVVEDAAFYNERFERSKNGLGVLLLGEKGCGKSLLAKHICATSPYPTIIMQIKEDELNKEEFTKLILAIKQPFILFIDEYEKLFNKSDMLISLMDGITSNTKIFWLLTANEKNISYYLENRPSRIRYVQKYEALTEAQIEEILEEILNDKDRYKADLIKCSQYYRFNIDLLISLVEELNETGRDLKKVLSTFNIVGEETRYDYIFINTITGKSALYTSDVHPIYSEKDEFLSEGPEVYLPVRFGASSTPADSPQTLQARTTEFRNKSLEEKAELFRHLVETNAMALERPGYTMNANLDVDLRSEDFIKSCELDSKHKVCKGGFIDCEGIPIRVEIRRHVKSTATYSPLGM